ncbi:fimbrial protein [Ahrensia sp. R2A130]|nr:fimbrial protein [Ahrensia sp. R2A130]
MTLLQSGCGLLKEQVLTFRQTVAIGFRNLGEVEEWGDHHHGLNDAPTSSHSSC